MLFDECVCPENYVPTPAANVFQNVLTEFFSLSSDEQSCVHQCVAEVLLDRMEMLFGQEFCRSHEGNLIAVVNGEQRREQCHDGFSGTHIPLKQSVHRTGGFHV